MHLVRHHGLGRLVIYLISKLHGEKGVRDIHGWIFQLESFVIAQLDQQGIKAERRKEARYGFKGKNSFNWNEKKGQFLLDWLECYQ